MIKILKKKIKTNFFLELIYLIENPYAIIFFVSLWRSTTNIYPYIIKKTHSNNQTTRNWWDVKSTVPKSTWWMTISIWTASLDGFATILPVIDCDETNIGTKPKWMSVNSIETTTETTIDPRWCRWTFNLSQRRHPSK